MKFKNFLSLSEMLEKNKSIILEKEFIWTKDIKLPIIDIGLPKIEKKSKIIFINDKINPIFIQLKDGSKLFFTYDEFKRIEGTPKLGKEVYMQMQRLSNDNSEVPSKIISCKII